MTMKTYSGSCHCGDVRFEADIDLSAGSNRCNCSVCKKARAWFVIVKADHFREIAGTDRLTEYQWTPEGRKDTFLHYRFCKTCGIRTAGYGGLDAKEGGFYFVSVAALDNVDRDDLASMPIRYADGLHNRFDSPPADPQLL
jgi:hypothetical protein